MKTKTLTKKLSLNKEKIASLNPGEMSRIIGASVFVPCTESCSIFEPCCGPTTEKDNNKIDLDKGKG